jgi:hypothetical protein
VPAATSTAPNVCARRRSGSSSIWVLPSADTLAELVKVECCPVRPHRSRFSVSRSARLDLRRPPPPRVGPQHNHAPSACVRRRSDSSALWVLPGSDTQAELMAFGPSLFQRNLFGATRVATCKRPPPTPRVGPQDNHAPNACAHRRSGRSTLYVPPGSNTPAKLAPVTL